MSKITNSIRYFFYCFFRLFPVKKHTVLMFSYYGEQYSGSPKYISRYLTDKSEYRIVWAFTNRKKHPEYTGKSVHYSGMQFLYYLATSGTIITNYRMEEYFNKRKHQKYIQTWHSSLRLKMIENDAADTLPPQYINMAKRDSEQIDILLAGSKKSREIFERAFWYKGVIVNTGTPQCDILFEDREIYSKLVKKHFNLSADTHIAMYAPTFRKNHNTDVYQIDMLSIVNSFEKRFGGTWVLLVRLHPHLVHQLKCIEYSKQVIQATDYDDVQELLCAVEFLISDYSAIMFDYALTRKPCILYTPDLEDYLKNDRKLYFDINDLPFEHIGSQYEICNNIENFSITEYESRINKFLQEIGNYEDGNACKRVYERVCETFSVNGLL